MNRQKSLDILQYNQQEAQKNLDKKKKEVRKNNYITIIK